MSLGKLCLFILATVAVLFGQHNTGDPGIGSRVRALVPQVTAGVYRLHNRRLLARSSLLR